MDKKTSRREFIKKVSLATAALTIGGIGMSAASYRRIVGANGKLNVAIVGLGRRLGAYYAPIANKDSNVQLLYLCDVMQSQREKAAQNFSKHIDYKPKLENSIFNVIADPDVDAVINATPDHWHAPGTILAVAAGKHVYVEKPCSHNPREGELLVEAQKKYKKVIQMGNQQRSAIQSIEIIKEIHNGIIGIPYSEIGTYSRDHHPDERILIIHGTTIGIGMVGILELPKQATTRFMNWILHVGHCRWIFRKKFT